MKNIHKILNKWRIFKTVQRDNPRSDSINAPYERKVRVTRYSGLELCLPYIQLVNCGMCLTVIVRTVIELCSEVGVLAHVVAVISSEVGVLAHVVAVISSEVGVLAHVVAEEAACPVWRDAYDRSIITTEVTRE